MLPHIRGWTPWFVAICLAGCAGRFGIVNTESPSTGPAGVAGSGGTGAAGSVGSGGTMGGTTTEAARESSGAARTREALVTDAGALLWPSTPR